MYNNNKQNIRNTQDWFIWTSEKCIMHWNVKCYLAGINYD